MLVRSSFYSLINIRQHHRPLDADSGREVLRHLHRLWGFDVHLESVDNGSVVERLSIPSHRLD